MPSRFGAYVGEILGDGYDKVDLFIPAIKKLMEDDALYSQKACKAIHYIRNDHNIKRFVKNVRKHLKKEVKRTFKNLLKYNVYRILSNLTIGDLKKKYIAKKQKYKEAQ